MLHTEKRERLAYALRHALSVNKHHCFKLVLFPKLVLSPKSCVWRCVPGPPMPHFSVCSTEKLGLTTLEIFLPPLASVTRLPKPTICMGIKFNYSWFHSSLPPPNVVLPPLWNIGADKPDVDRLALSVLLELSLFEILLSKDSYIAIIPALKDMTCIIIMCMHTLNAEQEIRRMAGAVDIPL